jgi:NAD(P)-dependent dehydrogenase (short-subunit alcohol dehydrogenase family)
MKTFLSIGAGPGNGLATAERFAREGFRIVLASRDAGKTEQLAAGLRDKGHSAEARTLDASDDASVAGLVREVETSFGAIDVLHYNAASLRNATIADQPGETFNADLAVNIGGALSAIKAASPAMLERGEGTILLTGGGLSVKPKPDFLSLAIGKVGIRTLAKGLFAPFKAQGVHIASLTVVPQIKPGSAEADAVGEHFWQLHAQALDAWTDEATYAG